MGFGFNLFFIFVLLPITVILLIIWLVTRKNIFGKTISIIWLTLISLGSLSYIVQLLTAKKVLKKKDYYGEYTINRNFFRGKQADWQYDHFRMEIKENDSIYFHVIDKGNIMQTYKGAISTVHPFGSERLVIRMSEPTHHILTSNPTVYRSSWDFHLVFNSPKFGNVFFKLKQREM